VTTVTEPDELRARRSDVGRVRLNTRDVEALAWIWDMGAVSEPDLAVLLSRISERDEVLSDHAARAVVKRWRRAGLAVRGRPFTSTPAFAWLTPAGAMRIAGVESYREPAIMRLPHLAAVARGRLFLEAFTSDVRLRAVEWKSERQYRAERDPFRRRGAGADVAVPDGEARMYDGVTAAVEVELTAKTVERTREKMLALLAVYGRVVYLVPGASAAERAVYTACQEVDGRPVSVMLPQTRADLDKILIYPLPGRLDR
jgi:hypothetical protein